MAGFFAGTTQIIKEINQHTTELDGNLKQFKSQLKNNSRTINTYEGQIENNIQTYSNLITDVINSPYFLAFIIS